MDLAPHPPGLASLSASADSDLKAAGPHLAESQTALTHPSAGGPDLGSLPTLWLAHWPLLTPGLLLAV